MAVIPLSDVSRRPARFPVMTASIIAVNALVFLLELIRGETFVTTWSVKPADVVAGHHLITILTSTFMHASWSHIIGNMVFLWAFGPEVEDLMNPRRYLVFYLLGGLAATAAQVGADPSSTVPNLGASGAIAGVLGAFLVVFPRDRILVYIFPFWHARITAMLLIGFWFVTQLVSGFGSITSTTQGGVAYFAHIGGFIAGLVLVKLFGAGRRPEDEPGYQQLGG